MLCCVGDGVDSGYGGGGGVVVQDAGPCSQMAGFSASIEIDAMMEEIENIKRCVEGSCV